MTASLTRLQLAEILRSAGLQSTQAAAADEDWCQADVRSVLAAVADRNLRPCELSALAAARRADEAATAALQNLDLALVALAHALEQDES